MDNREVKQTLQRLLQRNADRLGLTLAAIDTLTQQATVIRLRAAAPLFVAADASDLVSFVADGVVKVTCRGEHGERMTVGFMKPAQFVVTGWLFDRRPPQRKFSAVAHEDSIVAVWSQQAIAGMLERLPPSHASQLMSYGWRAFSSLLHQKFLMLSMDIRERLLFQLRLLARDHGQPSEGLPAGVVIGLRLTQQDLAEVVIAGRANVARTFRKLRDEGLVTTVGRHIVVTDRALSAAAA